MSASLLITNFIFQIFYIGESLRKVDKFIIQSLTGISKKNDQRFNINDTKLDLILEHLLHGVRSVSLEETNVHIPVDNFSEWMDLERALTNKDTAIALVRRMVSIYG